MANVASSFQVAMCGAAAWIKPGQRADSNSSAELRQLLAGLRAKGFRQVRLDMSECLIMDSTFLGVLTRLALDLRPQPGQSDGDGVWLLGANKRIKTLVDNLGVADYYTFKECSAGAQPGYQAAAPTEKATREDLSRTCLEAHQTLMDINPENTPKFKDVTRFLVEDLKRLKSLKPPGAQG